MERPERWRDRWRRAAGRQLMRLALTLLTLAGTGLVGATPAMAIPDGDWLLSAEIYQVRAVRCSGIDSNSKPDLTIKVDGYSEDFHANRCNRNDEKGKPLWTVGFFQSTGPFFYHTFKIELWDRDDWLNGKDDHLDIKPGEGKDLHLAVQSYGERGVLLDDKDRLIETWFKATKDPNVYVTNIIKMEGSNALVRFRLKLERVPS